jgi:hypothetical protein
MSLLVRKINRSKWALEKISDDNDVCADAITNCLRTTSNKLSVWEIDSDEDLDQAVLALVANQEHLDKIDVVIMEECTLEKLNIKIIASPGTTPVESLINKHKDITELSYNALGILKDHIIKQIKNKRLKRYTFLTLKKMLQNAIDEGLLDKNDLKDSVRSKI